VVFITGEGPPNILLLPMQLRSPSVDRFLVYFSVSTFDVVVLCHAACLTGELTIYSHPIKVLV
jgi:hypothetical protein